MQIFEKYPTPKKPRVITHPRFKDEKLDIAIVIPCYNEGDGVIPAIKSAMMQMHRESTRIGIFLVVNSPLNVQEDILKSNKETAKTIIDILRNTPTDNPEIQLCQRFTNFPLYLVDAYTQKSAPKECNVGYARDVGTQACLPFLKSPHSIITHTDADCTLEAGYILGIEEDMMGKDIHIATGDRNFVFPENIDREKVTEIAAIESEIRKDVMRLSLSGVEYKYITIPFTPGSHMLFTQHLYKEIGGFAHIGGAEDVNFGTQARKRGYEISYFEDIAISTLARVSFRTSQGHGFGFDIGRKQEQSDIFETPSKSIEHLQTEIFFEEILCNAHALFFPKKGEDTRNTRRKWEQFVKKSFSSYIPNIDINDIQELSEIYFESYGKLSQADNYNIEGMFPFLISHMKILLHKYFDTVPLGEALDECTKKLRDILFQRLGEILEYFEEDQELISSIYDANSLQLYEMILVGLGEIRIFMRRNETQIQKGAGGNNTEKLRQLFEYFQSHVYTLYLQKVIYESYTSLYWEELNESERGKEILQKYMELCRKCKSIDLDTFIEKFDALIPNSSDNSMFLKASDYLSPEMFYNKPIEFEE